MKKQKLVCMLLLIVMLLPMLSSCMGSSDSFFEYIEVEDFGDGSTKVTVQFLDEDSPRSFVVPAGGDWGKKGDKGDDGKGIQGLVLGMREDVPNIASMVITYTDGTGDTFEFETGKDGLGITSAALGEGTIKDANGEDKQYMVITFSDGTDTNIILPEGAPGVGIKGVERLEGTDTMRVYYTDLNEDGTNRYFDIELPRGVGYTGVVSVDYDANKDGVPGVSFRFQLDLPEVDENGEVKKDENGDIIYKYSDGIFIPTPYPQGIYKVDSKDILGEDGNRKGQAVTFYIKQVDAYGNEILGNDGEVLLKAIGDAIKLYDGATIVDVKQKLDANEQPIIEDGQLVLEIIMSDDRSVELKVPMVASVGIENVELGDDPKNSANYLLTFTYTDPEKKPAEISFRKNSTVWMDGEGDPANNKKANETLVAGDYFFDHAADIIYQKNTDGGWDRIVDFGTRNVSVVFHISEERGDSWQYNGETRSMILESGSSCFAQNKPVPVPRRDGYEFIGWYTIDNITNNQDYEPTAADGVFNSMTVIPKGIPEMHLYAYWKPLGN